MYVLLHAGHAHSNATQPTEIAVGVAVALVVVATVAYVLYEYM